MLLLFVLRKLYFLFDHTRRGKTAGALSDPPAPGEEGLLLLEGIGPEEQGAKDKSDELHVHVGGGVWLREGGEEVGEGARRAGRE